MLVWFRGKDLRLADHAPLRAALATGEVIPLFVLDPYFFAPARAALIPHRMQFLLEALVELEASIAARASRLLVVAGRADEVVPRLAARWRVDRVVAQRWVEPFGRERDRRVAAAMRVPLGLYEGETLLPPGRLRSGAGTPYAVFSQFARRFRDVAAIAASWPAPRRLPQLPREVTVRATASRAALGLTPNPSDIRRRSSITPWLARVTSRLARAHLGKARR